MPDAHPLEWPLAVPRTPASERQRARFGKRNERGWGTNQLTVKQALDRLLGEIGRYGRVDAESVVVSTNVRTRNDGLPYSNAREPDDPGVCVYFELDGFPVALPCDTFDRVADNIAAIAGHIEADRRQERYGVGTASQRYAGFKALPEQGSGRPWWKVLEIDRDASEDEIRRAYRRRAAATHPDRNPDDPAAADAFHQVQRAYEQAMQQFAETDA